MRSSIPIISASQVVYVSNMSYHFNMIFFHYVNHQNAKNLPDFRVSMTLYFKSHHSSQNWRHTEFLGHTGLMTQPAVSKHWRRVVSHPDSSQSHQAHLTMSQ